MTRIFSVLAICSIGLLLANITVGLWGGDYNGRSQQLWESQRRLVQLRQDTPPDTDAIAHQREQMDQLFVQLKPMQRYATFHMLLGVMTALVVVLVNSIAVTYFIGTSRWCKEVSQAYQLPPELAQRSTALKRRSFPWALMAMLVAVAIVALGAAADPGTLRPGTPKWVLPHATAAIVGGLCIAWSLLVQYSRIAENHGVINEILARVNRIRKERGLDVQPSSEPAAG